MVVTRRGKPVATLKAFEQKDLEKQERYPSSAYDNLKKKNAANYPKLAKESPEQGRRRFDRFFPRDSLYSQNETFVEKLDSIDAAISSFTLLAVCGAASFRLSIDELSAWLFTFDAMYPFRS